MRMSQMIAVGIVDTLILGVILYSVRIWGVFGLDYASLFGLLTTGKATPPVTLSWLVGLCFFVLIFAVFLPVVYGYFFAPRQRTGRPWLRAFAFGVVIWLVMGLLLGVEPGVGFFAVSGPRPLFAVVGMLIGHLVYALILGVINGPVTVPTEPPSRQIQAGARG